MEVTLDICEVVEGHGFVRLAVLRWSGSGEKFELEGAREKWLATKAFIYAWVDRGGRRVLNVGHTGQKFSGRFGDYLRWLNGMRKNDCDTPIRHAWLDCIRECRSGEIEIWVRASVSDRAARELDERQWILRLQPILNRR